MSVQRSSGFGRLAVIGAGNMGSGIAQKMATEGFDVTLVDVDESSAARGREIIRKTLAEGVERKVFRADQAESILGRVTATSDWTRLGQVDLAVEAVFEDAGVKRDVFARLDEVCRPEAILATNTSSLSVTELAAATRRPERVVGLHYFYHPAKNRLVEVVPGRVTDPAVVQAAWSLQEQLGKTPIVSADAPGFIVNRFFVPWLNEAVRLLEEGVADIPTIEAACKAAFGVGMGPFELMNVTGIPIALHAATTLGQRCGALYAPAARLAAQVEARTVWPLDGEADPSRFPAVAERMHAVVFFVAASLVDEKVGTREDTDIGARVGLRWPRGPFELMNRLGIAQAAALAEGLARRWSVEPSEGLARQVLLQAPYHLAVVRSERRDGVATLTINRPDALNALNEEVVAQLQRFFETAVTDPEVSGIVIAGAGKAFVAGADIRFFVKHIEAQRVDRIVEFTRAGHALLDAIDRSPKPVVARVHGLALGGGLELALACDHIVASTRASMAFPETGIGIYPGLGGTQRTPRRIGTGLAKWLIYTGQPLSAEEALAVGLVDRVVPPQELDAAVREALWGDLPERPRRPDEFASLERVFAAHPAETLRRGEADTGGDARATKAQQRVASKAPIALQIAERLIDASESLPLESGLALELEHLQTIFATADAYTGLSSLGRSRPEFQGR